MTQLYFVYAVQFQADNDSYSSLCSGSRQGRIGVQVAVMHTLTRSEALEPVALYSRIPLMLFQSKTRRCDARITPLTSNRSMLCIAQLFRAIRPLCMFHELLCASARTRFRGNAICGFVLYSSPILAGRNTARHLRCRTVKLTWLCRFLAWFCTSPRCSDRFPTSWPITSSTIHHKCVPAPRWLTLILMPVLA